MSAVRVAVAGFLIVGGVVWWFAARDGAARHYAAHRRGPG